MAMNSLQDATNDVKTLSSQNQFQFPDTMALLGNILKGAVNVIHSGVGAAAGAEGALSAGGTPENLLNNLIASTKQGWQQPLLAGQQMNAQAQQPQEQPLSQDQLEALDAKVKAQHKLHAKEFVANNGVDAAQQLLDAHGYNPNAGTPGQPTNQPTTQPSQPTQNINPPTPFSGAMGALKAILPYPFAMPDLMAQSYQQGYASTPQGMIDIRKAENALPLSTQEKSARELSIIGGQREAAQNQLADYHNQMTELAAQDTNAHAEATAAMSTAGMLGRGLGKSDVLEKLQKQIATNDTARRELLIKIKQANQNLYGVQKKYIDLASSQDNSQGSLLPELQSLAKSGAKITRIK